MKHNKRLLTKSAMTHIALRMPRALRDLTRAAARQEEMSQSDFMRRAFEERARRILLREQQA